MGECAFKLAPWRNVDSSLQSCKWSLECFARSNRKNLCDVGGLHTAPSKSRRVICSFSNSFSRSRFSLGEVQDQAPKL